MGTQNRCGVEIRGCRDVSGGQNRRAHTKEQTPFLHPPPETSSPGRTPGPPTGKSPHLQAFGKEAFLQQECPPKSPRGESAVASLGVENPKVAPEWGRRRGREAGLTPDKELPSAVKDPLVSAPALEEGGRTNYQGGFPGSGCPSVHRQATGIHKPA